MVRSLDSSHEGRGLIRRRRNGITRRRASVSSSNRSKSPPPLRHCFTAHSVRHPLPLPLPLANHSALLLPSLSCPLSLFVPSTTLRSTTLRFPFLLSNFSPLNDTVFFLAVTYEFLRLRATSFDLALKRSLRTQAAIPLGRRESGLATVELLPPRRLPYLIQAKRSFFYTLNLSISVRRSPSFFNSDERLTKRESVLSNAHNHVLQRLPHQLSPPRSSSRSFHFP